MSDPKNEKTVITLKIELPTEVAIKLSDDYWTRVELTLIDLLRLNEPCPTNFCPVVWRERSC